ncbi:Hpt domain-containing protein [Leptospira sp. 2 VSF19]|uniref:Hpt domain-containing protein n=1 Tax=Leptospira soteropolitanensis TaxID=2950025 RepID=A0AAW5VEC1_9LEPT|nr:Hpt domain-containing protein [Leptospira soteropolitanensis]MCW7491885.1 Hpt domain-containing protein [Leptospira soteropolitanensis]MCW7499469.1 Hpt domain-containing protein [Leptospira soteropolitanensis]MCW7520940.1 Hpt domain-containing protein [Leptospira soteropolitanensis]MCW7525573.1 Hpt domain-containing protein [Leptospira soteropolitanensis]MCW7529439.1 Hpt domain-containing protein [Leptospira soteropolitanensis]
MNDPEDQAWLKEMIASLLENMATRVENLGRLLVSKEQKDLQAELHQIKGVAANFGLAALSEVVIKAEGFAKTGEIDASVEEGKKIAPIWESTRQELEKKFST